MDSRVLLYAHIHRISVFVVQDVPVRDSFLAEAQPYGEREEDLYRDEERRGGYAHEFNGKDVQGNIPDIQRSRIRR